MLFVADAVVNRPHQIVDNEEKRSTKSHKVSRTGSIFRVNSWIALLLRQQP